MNLTSLTSSDLKHIMVLLQRREALQAQITKIDRSLAAYDSGSAKPRPVTRAGKRHPRGSLKAAIVSLVQQAGPNGIKVRDIADRLGLKPDRVHAWFYITGKNVREIKKLGEATYGWAG
jgi:hypothetical protein